MPDGEPLPRQFMGWNPRDDRAGHVLFPECFGFAQAGERVLMTQICELCVKEVRSGMNAAIFVTEDKE